MFRWYLYPVGGDHYLLVVAVALALSALLWLVPSPRGLPPGRRRVLAVLRAAVVVLVVLAMLRPTLVLTESQLQSATLVLLVDQSRSMTVQDEVNGHTRWEAAKKTLDAARDALRKLAGQFEVKAYSFDAESHPVDIADGRLALPESPEGSQTAIGSVLGDVLRQEAGKRLLGVVLLSDGAQRSYPPRDSLPQAAAAELRRLGYPLYTLRFGQSRGLGQAQDVAVTQLVADPTVFVKNELAVSAQIRIDGYVNRDVPVKLLVERAPGKMETVAQQTLRATEDGQRLPLRFTYIPESPGEFKLTVEVEPQAGEFVTTNNRVSTYVHVLKGGLQVLYIESFPGRPEFRFLSQSLASSPDVRVQDVLLHPAAPEVRPAGMAEWFRPGKFDVYIVGDVDASLFRPDELKGLAEAVSRGAGLIMLGGLHSFGPGGYAESPLAQVLPVQMNRLERQPLGGTADAGSHLPGPIKIVPSANFQAHASLRLAADPAESAKIWAQLPALDEGANRLIPKRLAQVLATDDRDQPLLIAQEYEAGRTMAFAVDSTWHWWMRGFESAHKRFWRQTVLWLARKDESTEGNVWIKLAQRRFDPSQRVEFTAGANGPNGEPVPNVEFAAEIERPDGTRQSLPLVRRAQESAGSYRDTLLPGDYAVRVVAKAQGKELGSARSRFLVAEQDLELDNPLADPTLLDNLATMTGGKSLVPEELAAQLERLAEQRETLEVETEVKRTFWDSWPFFFLLISLLGGEWYLRKRWGLV